MVATNVFSFNQQHNINNNFERTTKVHIIINSETSIIQTTINQNVYLQTFERGCFTGGLFYYYSASMFINSEIIKHHQASVLSL